MSRCTSPKLWMYFRPMDTCKSKSFNSALENISPWISFVLMTSLRLPPSSCTCSDVSRITNADIKFKIKRGGGGTKELTITVFILNNHVVFLCPGRIIADHMGMVAKNCMCIHFLESQLPKRIFTFTHFTAHSICTVIPANVPRVDPCQSLNICEPFEWTLQCTVYCRG